MVRIAAERDLAPGLKRNPEQAIEMGDYPGDQDVDRTSMSPEALKRQCGMRPNRPELQRAAKR